MKDHSFILLTYPACSVERNNFKKTSLIAYSYYSFLHIKVKLYPPVIIGKNSILIYAVEPYVWHSLKLYLSIILH